MFLFFILLLLWILISGYFSFLPLVPGLLGLVLTIIIIKKAKSDSSRFLAFSLQIKNFFFYIFYMIKEIYNSNIFVAKAILTNSISPVVFSVSNTFKSNSASTTFANSVTITPGTIVIESNKKEFIIHALTTETKEGVLDYTMYNRVLSLEPSQVTEEK